MEDGNQLGVSRHGGVLWMITYSAPKIRRFHILSKVRGHLQRYLGLSATPDIGITHFLIAFVERWSYRSCRIPKPSLQRYLVYIRSESTIENFMLLGAANDVKKHRAVLSIVDHHEQSNN